MYKRGAAYEVSLKIIQSMRKASLNIRKSHFKYLKNAF